MKGGILIFIILFWLLPTILKNAKKKPDQQKSGGPGSGARPAAQRQTPSVELNRPAPSMQRPAASASHAPRSAQRDYRAPEAPCIVCENTGDDHFQRDKARRIAQLDEWLKNGLIDREEYRVMKDRYQRGI